MSPHFSRQESCSTLFPHNLIFFLQPSLTSTLSEHDGLKENGEPDGRVGTGEFAHGKVDPVEAGKKGGEVGGSAGGEATSGGSGGQGQFAGGKVDPVEAGKKGGSS